MTATSLLYRAANNCVDSVLFAGKFREGVLSAICDKTHPLYEPLITADPTERVSFPEEHISLMDGFVPLSLLPVMKAANFITNSELDCAICSKNASILNVPCCAPWCNVVAHPACLHLRVDTKEELIHLIDNGKWYCKTHESLMDDVSTEALAEFVRCSLPDCQARIHLNIQFSNARRMRAFLNKGNFVCKVHATPRFVAVDDGDFNPTKIAEDARIVLRERGLLVAATTEEEQAHKKTHIEDAAVAGLAALSVPAPAGAGAGARTSESILIQSLLHRMKKDRAEMEVAKVRRTRLADLLTRMVTCPDFTDEHIALVADEVAVSATDEIAAKGAIASVNSLLTITSKGYMLTAAARAELVLPLAEVPGKTDWEKVAIFFKEYKIEMEADASCTSVAMQPCSACTRGDVCDHRFFFSTKAALPLIHDAIRTRFDLDALELSPKLQQLGVPCGYKIAVVGDTLVGTFR